MMFNRKKEAGKASAVKPVKPPPVKTKKKPIVTSSSFYKNYSPSQRSHYTPGDGDYYHEIDYEVQKDQDE